MDILQVGTRRFRVPKGQGTTSSVPEQSVDIEWPANKKLGRLLCDSLHEHSIPYTLHQENKLYVDHPHPENIKHMLQFKIRTFNHAYTHFISLPLQKDRHMQDAFGQFKEEAMDLLDIPKKYAAMGHKSRLFTLPNRLHLTVLMVTVMDESDLQKGRSIIESLQLKTPIMCTLNGLNVIKGTTEAARVLIAKVNSNEELDRLAADLRTRFLSNGLTDNLDTLWHCTLANAKYFDRFYKTQGCTFDARKALRKLSFGPCSIPINAIHLSSLRSDQTDPSGYYYAEAIKTID